MGLIFWGMIGSSIIIILVTSTFWSIAYEILNAKFLDIKNSLSESEIYIQCLIRENQSLKIKKISEQHQSYDEGILEDIENGFGID